LQKRPECVENKGLVRQKEGQETKRDTPVSRKTEPTRALLFRSLPWTLEHANTEFWLNRDDHG
jgi:hypothetical protein